MHPCSLQDSFNLVVPWRRSGGKQLGSAEERKRVKIQRKQASTRFHYIIITIIIYLVPLKKSIAIINIVSPTAMFTLLPRIRDFTSLAQKVLGSRETNSIHPEV
jgi:hypothetical protein